MAIMTHPGLRTVHLNVVHDTHGRDVDPSSAGRVFSCARTDFAWNDDFTAYVALPLTWWDDASYIAYQSGDNFAYDEG